MRRSPSVFSFFPKLDKAELNPVHLAKPGQVRLVLLLVVLVLQGLFTVQGQILESAQLITERDIAWMQNNGFPDAQNGVAVYKLRYWTPDLGGNTSIATAAFVSPVTDCAKPLVC
ncbi:MAG: hypothetical protein ABI373_06170, partial [Flavobacteriales bacterium]